MSYSEDDYLQLSGLQHFAFCRRQWALIHIEQQWKENLRTVEGSLLHERAHEESLVEKRGNVITMRGLRVASSELGISGSCDVVEFHRCEKGAHLSGEKGTWRPYPVEYKHGVKKTGDADRLQLCAQAMCLEEMLGCPVPAGALFYAESRRRESVQLDDSLRGRVRSMLAEMHEYLHRRYTPKVKTGKHCNACSLKEVCLPILCRSISVSEYVRKYLEE